MSLCKNGKTFAGERVRIPAGYKNINELSGKKAGTSPPLKKGVVLQHRRISDHCNPKAHS